MVDEKRSRFPVAFLAGTAVVLLLVAGFYLLTRNSRFERPAPETPLPMTSAEQAYAQKIRFAEPEMNRVANFLNQEVTFVYGTMINDGERTIRRIEVTLEFRDMFSQVVLRDSRRLIGPREASLGPGESREFQLGYEHLPQDWNRQYPSIRVTGLLLQ